jgi:deoxycytidine triphosphate deaminase
MILSDREILKAIADGAIIVEPVPGEEQYTTSALDLILGSEFWEFKSASFVLRNHLGWSGH